MNLNIFFNSLEVGVAEPGADLHSFRHYIDLNYEEFPAWPQAQIALIGLHEGRGNPKNHGAELAADEIRKELYRLKKGSGSCKIVDLGNLRPAETLAQTNLRLKEVCQILIEKGILPVVIGGTHDLCLGMWQAYEEIGKPVVLTNIDSAFDLEEGVNLNPSATFLSNLFVTKDSYLSGYNHIGYQSYLVSEESLEYSQSRQFNCIRLGELREDIREVEPYVREADMVMFDFTAIKSSDAPGSFESRPFGLSGEEACQLAWYAGCSPHLSSFGLFEYNPLQDEDHRGAKVAACIIWYVIEGFKAGQRPMRFDGDKTVRYLVPIDGFPHHFVFYKNQLTNTWWMALDGETGRPIPCSHSDYLQACHGEIPSRWIKSESIRRTRLSLP
jgi:formiminoglutamase